MLRSQQSRGGWRQTFHAAGEWFWTVAGLFLFRGTRWCDRMVAWHRERRS